MIFIFHSLQSEDYNTMLGFKMSSHKHAKAIWKTCVEYHSFFRLNRTAKSTSKQSKSYFTVCTDTAQTAKEHEEQSQNIGFHQTTTPKGTTHTHTCWTPLKQSK